MSLSETIVSVDGMMGAVSQLGEPRGALAEMIPEVAPCAGLVAVADCHEDRVMLAAHASRMSSTLGRRTKAPCPCCDQIRPSERSRAIASRTTLRLTPKVWASACSVGSWSPTFSRPWAISREMELATRVDRCGPRLTLFQRHRSPLPAAGRCPPISIRQVRAAIETAGLEHQARRIFGRLPCSENRIENRDLPRLMRDAQKRHGYSEGLPPRSLLPLDLAHWQSSGHVLSLRSQCRTLSQP